MSDEGSNQQAGLEGWREVKFNEIKTSADLEMWCWNKVTDTNWIQYLWIIGIVIVLYLRFSE